MESVNLLAKIDPKLIIVFSNFLLVISIITMLKKLAQKIMESWHSSLSTTLTWYNLPLFSAGIILVPLCDSLQRWKKRYNFNFWLLAIPFFGENGRQQFLAAINLFLGGSNGSNCLLQLLSLQAAETSSSGAWWTFSWLLGIFYLFRQNEGIWEPVFLEPSSIKITPRLQNINWM